MTSSIHVINVLTFDDVQKHSGAQMAHSHWCCFALSGVDQAAVVVTPVVELDAEVDVVVVSLPAVVVDGCLPAESVAVDVWRSVPWWGRFSLVM